MPKRLVTASLMLFVFCTAGAGKNKPQPDAVMSDVTDRGRALYEYDQAGVRAAAAVQALHPLDESVGRYLALKSDARWTVAFGRLNDQHDKFLIGYLATQGGTLQEFTARKIDPPQEDTAFFLAAAKAFDTAGHDFQGEKRHYKVAVLPSPSNQLFVYIVPAQTKAGIYPLGGDVRYLITADGGTILEKRQLHKSILEMQPDSVPPGSTPAGGLHTHVLSDVPEDTDVLYVLTRRPSEPEVIATMNKRVYEINVDGTIRILRK